MTTSTRRKTAAKKVAHPLEHLIPDPVFAEEYVSRQFGQLNDLALLEYARATRKNVLMFGPTGPGKTSCVLAFAASQRIPLVTIQSNGGVDPNTFWGGLTIDPESGEFHGYQESEITQVIRHGGIVFIDEVNFLPQKVASVFHGLLDKRRQITLLDKGNEVIHAHIETMVVAAYNPDYEGTVPLNAAFKNRFPVKLRFEYDREVEKELVYMPIMLEVADKLRESQRNGVIETPVSTNMLIEFEELAVDLGFEFAVMNLLNSFHDDERMPVANVIDLHRGQIMDQLAEMERLAEAEEDEES